MRGAVRLRAGSLLGHHRPKEEEGASSYTSLGTRQPAKGTAASTSSQPQAVGFVGRYLRPLGLSACGDESLGSTCRNRLLKGACPPTKTTQTERQPTRTEAHRERVPPQAISGSEADSMSRGGYPVAGRPSSKSSSIGHTPSNEAVLTRTTFDTNQNSPGAGTPTGDFWKRSGQHEPRRVPGHGAPLIEVVFHWAHTFQRNRPHQSDTRQEPKRTGSGCPHRRFLGAKRTA